MTILNVVLLLFGLSSAAHADLVFLSYENNNFPEEACDQGYAPWETDFAKAISYFHSYASDRGLQGDARHFMGGTICSPRGTPQLMKIELLLEGSGDAVARILAEPPVFRGQYVVIEPAVSSVVQVTSRYYLDGMFQKHPVDDIFIRVVSSVREDYESFFRPLCRKDPSALEAALVGTPKESEAIKFINDNPTDWSLGYHLDLQLGSGSTVETDGILAWCSYPNN
ncbi:MAG: hypothetical protein AB7F86_08435 [Bdellovibrionales bacterium]